MAAIDTDTASLDRLSPHWRYAVPRVLQNGEQVLASFEVDLNHQLFFSTGVVCLTNRGLLASRQHLTLEQLAQRDAWDFWPLDVAVQLRLSDHAGVACLECVKGDQRLAYWRFTLEHNPAANRLVQQYKLEIAKLSGHDVSEDLSQPVCPTCWVPLPPDQDECPACTAENLTPPSTWTLFRLWRFCKSQTPQIYCLFF